jgi:hypothetical protein
MTDAVKVMGNMNTRYIDYFKPVETRTPEDIIENIRAGLERIGGDSGSI